ncbi:MAG: sigma-70 family RNA polymerase sigma factor [Planctomycetota bacterium]
MKDPGEDELQSLTESAARGDESALAQILELHRDRLYRMIDMRLDPRVRSRLDPSDVLQEAFVDARRRFSEYANDQKFSVYFWLRNVASNRLNKIHRHHLDAQLRDAKREISMNAGAAGASSVYLATQLVDSSTSIGRRLVRAEVLSRVKLALDQMAEKDREVIALRHFEELSTEETAEILGLTRSGVLKRYTRVLRKLREAFGSDSEVL